MVTVALVLVPSHLQYASTTTELNNYIIQTPENEHTLRIMGSQNWWFGDPRTLLYRVKPLHRRIQ